MTVSADPSPEPGELEQAVQAVILEWDATWPVSRAGEVIRIVRAHDAGLPSCDELVTKRMADWGRELANGEQIVRGRIAKEIEALIPAERDAYDSTPEPDYIAHTAHVRAYQLAAKIARGAR